MWIANGNFKRRLWIANNYGWSLIDDGKGKYLARLQLDQRRRRDIFGKLNDTIFYFGFSEMLRFEFWSLTWCKYYFRNCYDPYFYFLNPYWWICWRGNPPPPPPKCLKIINLCLLNWLFHKFKFIFNIYIYHPFITFSPIVKFMFGLCRQCFIAAPNYILDQFFCCWTWARCLATRSRPI